ncbi:MAG: MFS transporter [Janthinobacterium lividum]
MKPGPNSDGNSSSSSGWDTNYEWKCVCLLTLGFGLVGLDRWVIADLAAAKSSTMVADLHLGSPALVGNLVAILGVAWGVSSMFMGSLSDRYGRKMVLVPALIAFSLLSGFSGVASSFAAMLLMRATMGAAEGAYCPTSFATVAEASKPSRRGFNMGLQQSTFALFGLGFGPIIATQMLQYMSWRWVFAIVGIPGLIIAALVAMTIREPLTIRARRGAYRTPDLELAPAKFQLKALFSHRNIPLSMVTLLCAMCGIFVLSAFTPVYLTTYLKLSDQQMGGVVSAIGFGGFLGQWWLSGLSDRFGRRTMALAGFTVGALFLVFFMNAGRDNLLLLFCLLFVSAAFAFGLLSLITGPISAEAAPIGMIASSSGIIIGVGEIFGGGVAPSIAGTIASSYGVQYTLYLALGGLVVGAVVSLFYRETAPSKVGKGDGESPLDKLEDRVGEVTAA